MADRNRWRRTYEEVMAEIAADEDGANAEGIPCAKCGCRHSYVIRTQKIGGIVRRTRKCRHCGHEYYTTESV